MSMKEKGDLHLLRRLSLVELQKREGKMCLDTHWLTLANTANLAETPQAVNSEGKDDNDSEKYAILLMSRVDILCYKFIENIRKRLAKKNGRKKYESLNEKDEKKSFFTEMITIDETFLKKESVKTDNIIDDLDKYIESLNLEKDESNDLEISNTDDIEVSLTKSMSNLLSYPILKTYNNNDVYFPSLLCINIY